MVTELRSDPRREELHEILVMLLGTRNVYFQPPNNTKINYPCIVYNRGRNSSSFADNITYRYTKAYEVTVIDQDPNSETPDKVATTLNALHERSFVVDNLNHDLFNLYF